MCRGGKDGTIRRCPSHNDNSCIDKRNARRRELRGAKKTRASVVSRLTEANMNFVRGDSVTNAYFAGTAFDREKIKPVEDPDTLVIGERIYGLLKPENGSGFWTSPGEANENGEIHTEWTNWSHREGMTFQTGEEGKKLSHIKVMPDAVILVVDSDADLRKIYDKYPDGNGIRLSFEKMAADGIDGMHVTQNAINLIGRHYSDKDTVIQNLSGWDLESTVWLNGTFLQAGVSKEIKPIVAEPDPYEEAHEHYRDLVQSLQTSKPHLDINEKHMDTMIKNSFKQKRTETGNRELPENIRACPNPIYMPFTTKGESGTIHEHDADAYIVSELNSKGEFIEGKRYIMSGTDISENYGLDFSD